ncbi:hypothetical protein [Paenibacillus sp. FSL H7-0331]|uniref:hypothetical protein n=1 Tax=Paenibacillus sp. FSL H7-0331 TaxID=1920421 RepID=UPI00096EFF00|nr:hypothetical protein [Paenibacillus sp. FSL H7-0331]OMF11586.1 hypothetical protein BK127_24110 [Paenibacillus sp. FSL H7-0331]
MDPRKNVRNKEAPQSVPQRAGIASQAPLVPLEEELNSEETLVPSSPIPNPAPSEPPKKPNKWLNSILILLGVGLLFLTINYAFNESTPTLGSNVINKEQISSQVAAGTVLFNKEENPGLQAKDFKVNELKQGGPAKLVIWDFNVQDYDEVQIFVDGKPIHNSVVLTHTPAEFSVPVPSVVTIKGISDKGGGITYAVKFPTNNLTYFNVANVNEINTYTLVPGP